MDLEEGRESHPPSDNHDMVETRVLEIWNLGNHNPDHNKLKIGYNIMLENDEHNMVENDNLQPIKATNFQGSTKSPFMESYIGVTTNTVNIIILV